VYAVNETFVQSLRAISASHDWWAIWEFCSRNGDEILKQGWYSVQCQV